MPKEAEDIIFRALRNSAGSARELRPYIFCRKTGKKRTSCAPLFLSGAATTSQNSYTFLFPPIRFVGRAVISYSVPQQKRVLRYGLKLEPLGEIAMRGRSTTLRQMLPEFSDFFV